MAVQSVVVERIQRLLGVKLTIDQLKELDRFVSTVVKEDYVVRPVSELMRWDLEQASRNNYE